MEVVDKQPLVVVVTWDNTKFFQASWTDELWTDVQKTLTNISFQWWDLIPYLLARHLFALGYNPTQQLLVKLEGEFLFRTKDIYFNRVKYAEGEDLDFSAALSENFGSMHATIGELLATPLINKASVFAQREYWTPPWHAEAKLRLVDGT